MLADIPCRYFELARVYPGILRVNGVSNFARCGRSIELNSLISYGVSGGSV